MLTAKLLLERCDKDYRLLEKREQPARSFLKNFIGLLYVAHANLQDAAPYTMNDITNTPRGIDAQVIANAQVRSSKANLKIGSLPGVSGVHNLAGSGAQVLPGTIPGEKIGIVVGIGTNAVTPTDVALQTRIEHGRNAGQFEYGGCELIGLTFANPNGEFSIRRYFTNGSGGAITVNEAGIYSVGTDYGSWGAWPFCIARDLVSPGVNVNINELLRVTYVVSITV